MRTIGVRELKAQLSRTLRDVQRGEHYLVTDRGRVVAELHMPGATLAPALSEAERARMEMAATGELRLAEKPRTPIRRARVKLPDGTAAEIIDWLRGDR